uniref:NudC domain-containing protein 1 n=1 Tax=Bos mutus grunniens TaxID=30521 RepID=A0A8B9WIP6_BOSMU
MEVAANCSLRVKRPLLDPRFESYKLSLEPLPSYQLELDAAVAEVKLRDDQYTLEHMHAFGMYNYLHCDPWYQDSVYYIDNLGRIMNLTVMLDTALGKPREVFRLPTDLTACDNRLCASIHFTSSTWVTLSDGTGRLYLIGTGERGNSVSEKWEIVFNEELGNPFIIIHSISLLKAEEHSIATLLLQIEKEELSMKGSGFYVSLEWVTISKKCEDNKKYEVAKRNTLRGKSVPHYAAIEPDGNGLMIISYKPFTFVQAGQGLEESKDENMSEEIKEPLYYWQQTEDDLTVTIQLPEDCTKEDIQVQFLPDSVNIVLKGQMFLEGNLFSSIDHESSTWIIKENNSLEISLIKKSEGMTWPELVVGDKQGEFIRDSAQCAAIAERLMHLTSDELNPNPDKDKPPCNAQELEECDIFFEENFSLCRFDGNTLKTTHVSGLLEVTRSREDLSLSQVIDIYWEHQWRLHGLVETISSDLREIGDHSVNKCLCKLDLKKRSEILFRKIEHSSHDKVFICLENQVSLAVLYCAVITTSSSYLLLRLIPVTHFIL